jgi:hypothetical protein
MLSAGMTHPILAVRRYQDIHRERLRILINLNHFRNAIRLVHLLQQLHLH